MSEEPVVIPLRLKYRTGRQGKRIQFVPKYNRRDRSHSKKYQAFCRKHPKSRA